jgi:hypothetical protein
MLIMAYTVLAMMAITFTWLFIKLSRWTAPVAAAVGMLVFWVSLNADYGRGMAWGAGLVLFSAFFFMLSVKELN